MVADRWVLQQKQVTREPTPQGDGRVHTEGQQVISCPFPLGPLGDMRTGRERTGEGQGPLGLLRGSWELLCFCKRDTAPHSVGPTLSLFLIL